VEKIHILLAGEQLGPFSETQVRQYMGEGLVSPSDLAMCDGMADWQSVDLVLARLPAAAAPAETISSAAAPTSPPNAPAPPNASRNSGFLPSLREPTLSLTASQKTKRKMGKIVIQPILPLEATAPVKKKPRTGKMALAIEPPRPTTSLPPVTSRPAEKGKTKPLPWQSHFSPKDFSDKSAPGAPVSAPTSPVAPSAGTSPPPIPEKKTPSSIRTWFRRIPRRKILRWALYGGAGLGLLIIFGFLYSGSWSKDVPPATKPVSPASAPVPAAAAPVAIQPTETNPQTSEDYSNRGFARQARNDLDGAILDYSQALELDPKNIQAYYRRGLARQAKGDWEGALADYTEVLFLDPHRADAYSNRAFVKQARGDLDGALADYAQALALNPKIPVAYYNQGLIKVRKGDLDGAIADYDRALELDPKMAIAYYNRGNAKNTEGNLDGAIADYTQALALDPKIALAYCNRGFARQSKGDLDGALEDYAKALALNSKLAVAYYNRGLIKEQKGDLDGAISDSTQALRLDPVNAQAYCNRGLARLGNNDLDGAMTDLRKFCELAPTDPAADDARLYLWLISAQQNPKGNADQELALSLQNDWNSSPEELSSKIAAFLLGHIDENDLIANAASPDSSRDPGQHCKAWYFIGMKRLLAGDTAAAIDDLRKCLATDQKDLCEYVFAQAKLQTLGQPREASASPAAGSIDFPTTRSTP
jgi:tetratricopeptide (TPR) repeat protein